VQPMKLLNMQFSPISCHFISLRSKYSPQHPQSMFLPWCQRPRLTRDYRSNSASKIRRREKWINKKEVNGIAQSV
jgi:hypothetical protein